MKPHNWILDNRKFFSEEEQRLIREHVRRRLRHPDRKRWVEWFLIELAMETGLRVGEMSALVCGDLLIGDSLPGVVVRRGKGGKTRFVHVRQALCEKARMFLDWKKNADEPIGESDPLFRSVRTGRPMTVRGLQKIFERVLRATGIEGHSLHHCRHTYASELLRSSGGNLRIVQKQLGHSAITTTQIYADVFDPDMQQAVGMLYARRAVRPVAAPVISN